MSNIAYFENHRNGKVEIIVLDNDEDDFTLDLVRRPITREERAEQAFRRREAQLQIAAAAKQARIDAMPTRAERIKDKRASQRRKAVNAKVDKHVKAAALAKLVLHVEGAPIKEVNDVEWITCDELEGGGYHVEKDVLAFSSGNEAVLPEWREKWFAAKGKKVFGRP